MKKQTVTKFAILLLVFMLIILLILIRLRMYSYIFILISALVGIVTFLIINYFRDTRFISNGETWSLNSTKKRRLSSLLSIAFFLLLSISLLLISPGSGIKPLSYYIIVSICGALVAVDIIIVESKKAVLVNLAKSFILTLSIFFVHQIIFPFGIAGADMFYHLPAVIYPIQNSGYIPTGELIYESFPVHHILVSMTSSVSMVDPRILYSYIGAFLMVLCVPVAFLMGRYILGIKAGLFAALFFPVTGYTAYWAFHPAPIAYVLPLILILLFLTLYIYNRKNAGLLIMYIILSLSIIFCHPYSSVILLLILTLVFVVDCFVTLRVRKSKLKTGNLYLIFLTMLLVQWMYYSFLMSTAVGFFERYSAAITSESNIAQVSTYDIYPVELIFLNTFGIGLIGFLSGIGFLSLLSKKSSITRIFSGYTVGLVAVVGIGVIFNFVYLLPNRVFAYLGAVSLIILIPKGIEFLRLDKANKHILRTKIPALAVVTFLVFFFTTSSTISGFETSLFTGNYPNVKLYETPYERHAVNWLDPHLVSEQNDVIYVSRSFYAPLLQGIIAHHNSTNLTIMYLPMTEEHDDVNISALKNNSTVMFSEYDTDPGFISGITAVGRPGIGVYMRFNNSIIHRFSGLNSLYDNGKITIFHKAD